MSKSEKILSRGHGVDLTDQMSNLYEYDRKSDKWWKKVSYHLIMMTAVHAWVIYNDLNRKNPFISFYVTLAEELIQECLQTTAVLTVRLKKEPTRTKTSCKEFQVLICKICFAPYHS